MATYVVGDVQGCYQSLQRLLTACDFHPVFDHLVFAGDLIARGPDSLAVMHWVLEHQDCVSAVLGNHDLHFLSVASGLKPSKPKDCTEALLTSTACDAFVHWLRQCPLSLDVPQHNALIVHAGIWPGWTRETWMQEIELVHARLRSVKWIDSLASMYGDIPAHPNEISTEDDRARFVINVATRMRFVEVANFRLELKSKQAPNEAPDNLVAWMDAAGRTAVDRQILFGHWATLNGNRRNTEVYALDTGCVYGRQLSALRLDDRALITVDCADVT